MLRKIVIAFALLLAAFLAFATRQLTTYEDPPIDPSWRVEAPPEIAPGTLTVRFTGTSTLLFSDGETSWMVDGWFSRFGLLALLGEIEPDLSAIERGLRANGVDRLAAVIPAHSHFDHAMDSPEVAKRTGALLVGSESTANIGRGWGLDESQIRVAVDREPMRFGAFTITLIESKHFEFPDPRAREQALGNPTIEAPLVPPVGTFEYRVGRPYAIHVVHPAGRFLVQGSAGFVRDGLAGYEADVVFLGVGGLGTQSEQYRESYWRETVLLTKAAEVVPIHWDSLVGPIEGPFTGEVRAARFLSAGGPELRSFLEEKANADDAPRFKLLPRYDPVPVF